MKRMTRKEFLKSAAVTALGFTAFAAGCGAADAPASSAQASVSAKGSVSATKAASEYISRQAPVAACKLVAPGTGGAAKVYFTPIIDAPHLIKLYELIKNNLSGKIAIKLHTGEQHGPNILPRDLVQALQQTIPNSTLVETNTAYGGDRGTTQSHRETLKVNGWTFCPVDIMDEDGDAYLPVSNGFHLNRVAMGAHLLNYDSMLVLTHFKGHTMGGFGGSLKNIAIGNASGKQGKREVHGLTTKGSWVTGEYFMELLCDSGKATLDHFKDKIVYINVLRRMSVDCDCAGTSAKEPTIPDIGIVASTDLLAVDQASCDLVWSQPQNNDLVERILSRSGLRQLSAMAEKKLGRANYEFEVVS